MATVSEKNIYSQSPGADCTSTLFLKMLSNNIKHSGLTEEDVNLNEPQAAQRAAAFDEDDNDS